VARRALLAALTFLVAAGARAQLVPIARCNAAIPCNIPIGLRPADAAAWTPYSKQGQGGVPVSISAGIEEGLKPKVDTRAVSEDPSERAARIFLRRNPGPTTPSPSAASTPVPTPAPTPPQTTVSSPPNPPQEP
jgi:hypothetical protein